MQLANSSGFILSLYIGLVGYSLAESSISSQNFAGQKYLFQKGWFVITSPTEAWNEALKNHDTSHEAYLRAIHQIQLDPETFKDRSKSAVKWQKELIQEAKKTESEFKKLGKDLRKTNLLKANENFKLAWNSLVQGYISYGVLNSDDLQSIKEINTKFFKRVSDQASDFEEVLKPIRDELLTKSDISWKKHFQEGNWNFKEYYEKSGSRNNSLQGVWYILKGYVSWFSEAVVAPALKSGYQNTKALPYYTLDAFSKTFIGSFNVIHSLGANLYYTTKLGYRLISPSLEAGYLSSLALIQAIHGGVSGTALQSAGLINKVSVKSVAPILSHTKLIIEEAASKSQDAVTVVVHGTRGVGEVFAEKTESAVILSYSALSQIPPQILLTAANSAIFLIYDGPRLIIAKVAGQVGDMNISDLPVGTVIDIEKGKTQGLKVETLSEDPLIIKKVLEHAE